MAPVKVCLSRPILERYGDEIRQIAPDAALVVLDADGTYDGDPTGIEVFCFSVDLAGEGSLGQAFELLQAEGLRWVQAPGAGVELPIWSELTARGVRLTNAAGVHAEPVTQYIFTYVLHWERQVEAHRRQQADRVWEAVRSEDLSAKTIGIVGHGGIGSATARVAKAFGMRTLGLRRSAASDPNVDEWLLPDELPNLLRESDYVVLTLPLTDATRNLIGADELEAMGPRSVLINVARGGVVDHGALIGALENNTIRGATLDVVEPEPLPADSRLWELPNCIVTPHDAGYSPLAGQRLARLFVDNLGRFLAGDSLRNEIDPATPPAAGR